MAWELKIHHIDVGTGDSTLITTHDTVNGTRRSMLIDGGLRMAGGIVNTYLQANLVAGQALDRILVTHYDKDHVGGIASILTAELREELTEILAGIAARAAVAIAASNQNNSRSHQIAGAAAALVVAMEGGYNIPNGSQQEVSAISSAYYVAGRLNTPCTDQEAYQHGYKSAGLFAQKIPGLNPSLVAWKTHDRRKEIAEYGGIAAARNGGGTEIQRKQAASTEIEGSLQNATPVNSHFRTQRRFRSSTIIDTGPNSTSAYADYTNSIAGKTMLQNNYVKMIPGMGRHRTVIDLDNNRALAQEVLWNSGTNPIQAPAGAPEVFVVASNYYIRNAANQEVPIGAHSGNGPSIAVIVRFNDLHYYAGGDLPTEGEDLVIRDILANGLPVPNGNAIIPNHICAFKCGHHGSKTCSGKNFVQSLRAKAAFISCGSNTKYVFPHQEALDELQDPGSKIQRFYLSNCNFTRNHVPKSDQTNPVNQFRANGNKGFISGDNAGNNYGAYRTRGNIVLIASTASTTATPHSFEVEYYEADWGIFAGGTFLPSPFTDTITHTC